MDVRAGSAGETEGGALAPTTRLGAALAFTRSPVGAEQRDLAERAGGFGSWEWNVPEARASWSPNLHRLLGLEPGTPEPDPFTYLERVHPEEAEEFVASLERAVGSGTPFVLTHRLLTEPGDYRLFECAGAPHAAPSGEVRVVHAVVAPVAAGEGSGSLSAAFHAAPVGIALARLAGGRAVLEEVNDAFATLAGTTAAELQGSSLDDLFVPDDEETDLHLREMLAAGELDRYTVERRLAGEEERWVQVEAGLVSEPGADEPILVMHLSDVTARRSFEAELRHVADHDSLTGLLNRRRFLEELESNLALKRRYGGEAAVLIIDVDRLKQVNDTHGHATGDQLLRDVATTVQERVRTTDVVARLAGDEFAVLLPQANAAEARTLAQDIERRVADRRIAGEPISVSVGVAAFGGDSVWDADEIIAAADADMYRVKRGEREQGGASEHAARHGDQVRAAMREGRLLVYIQPALDLETRSIAHEELLLRIRDEEGEVIPAADFMWTVAYDPDLSRELDRWVLERAIERLEEVDVPVHINVSAATLMSERAREEFAERISQPDVDRSRLALEVREEAILRDDLRGRAAVERLAGTGCSIVLDDFSGSIEAFDLLHAIDFDEVKLAGAIGAELVAPGGDAPTLRAALKLARVTGTNVVAKQVESEELVVRLREHGVGAGQGHRLAVPSALGG